MVHKIIIIAKILQKRSECQELGIRAVGLLTEVVKSESRTAQPSCQSQMEEEKYQLRHKLTSILLHH